MIKYDPELDPVLYEAIEYGMISYPIYNSHKFIKDNNNHKPNSLHKNNN